MHTSLPIVAALAGASVSGAHAVDPAPALARAAVLDTSRQAVEQALGKPVRLEVRRFAVQGRWAFVFAALRESGGAPIDYAGTPKADAAAHGMASGDCALLLSKSYVGWSIVAETVGPTDMPWRTWPATYGAPKALFTLNER